MNNNTNIGIDATAMSLNERICWRSIFAGAVVAVAIGSLLNMLGIGLGMIIFDPDSTQAATFGSGVVAWVIISTIVYSIIGGWVTASRSHLQGKWDGMINAFVAWALATVFALAVISSTTGFAISGGMQILGQSLKYAGAVSKQLVQPAAKLMQPDAMANAGLDAIKQQLNQLSQNANGDEIKKAFNNPELLNSVKNLVSANNDQQRAQAASVVINYLQQNTNMSREDAEKTVAKILTTYDNVQQQIQQKLEQAKAASKKMADQATNAIGTATLITFFMLIIGAICSMLGGYIGIRQDRY